MRINNSLNEKFNILDYNMTPNFNIETYYDGRLILHILPIENPIYLSKKNFLVTSGFL